MTRARLAFVVLVLVAAVGCDPNVAQNDPANPCETDHDCAVNCVCDTGACVPGPPCGGEGECQCGDVGGGGEGEGGCGNLDVTLGAGTGLVATDANLTADPSSCGTSSCASLAGTTCFAFDVTLTGDASEADAIQRNNDGWITWAADGGDPAFDEHVCNGSAVVCDDTQGDVICVCGVCLLGPPTNLAAAINDGTQQSNGICATQ